MKTIKLGWVGSGFVGQLAHLKNYLTIPNVEIVGLAELRPNLGQLVCVRNGIERYYYNHLDLMNDNPNLDAIIAIVNRKHTYTVAKDILNKRYNLFTEKPMSPTSLQGQVLVNLAKKNNLNYAIGNMRRFDHGIYLAKKEFDKILKNKTFGKLISFRSFCNAGGDYCNIDGEIKTKEPRPNNTLLPIAPKWLDKKYHRKFEQSLNYFSHDINLIRFFFGNKLQIESSIISNDSINVSFENNGFSGVFQGNYIKQNIWDEGMDIIFQKGMIKIKLPPAFLRNQPAKFEIIRGENKISSSSTMAKWSWSFKLQAENYINSIRLNKQSISSGEDSLNDVKIIENIWKKFLKYK